MLPCVTTGRPDDALREADNLAPGAPEPHEDTAAEDTRVDIPPGDSGCRDAGCGCLAILGLLLLIVAVLVSAVGGQQETDQDCRLYVADPDLPEVSVYCPDV